MNNRYTKKWFAILAGATALSLTLAACGSNSNDTGGASSSPAASSAASAPASAASTAPAERTLKDGLGHDVKIPANPKRIIASYLEDHLVAIGVMPIAQWGTSKGSKQDYLNDHLSAIPPVPSDLPFEAVAGFNPDLLIIGDTSTVAGDKYSQYSKIAPTFVLGDEINGDWRQALLKVGEVLDKKAEAQKALDTYDQKAKDAKDKLQKASGAKSAAAIWLVGNKFFVVSEARSSGTVLYKDLGFTVPAAVKEISAAGKANWNSISMEKLATLDADYIFLVNSDTATGSEALKDPVWGTIPAVKNNQVFQFNKAKSWLYSGAVANSMIIDDVLKSIVK
ncbi:ABC transporter substrate-binding protein [Paenibacillus mesotrionivorans]|uniref:ABC transporter substrate-binding protein n=1 Tax=Paenibacillus mesotrionivorans TaxID=3160968 RepID=A0ACC7NZZ9_9BACL